MRKHITIEVGTNNGKVIYTRDIVVFIEQQHIVTKCIYTINIPVDWWLDNANLFSLTYKNLLILITDTAMAILAKVQLFHA